MDAKNAFKYYLIFFLQELFGLIVASNFVTPHWGLACILKFFKIHIVRQLVRVKDCDYIVTCPYLSFLYYSLQPNPCYFSENGTEHNWD